MYSLRNEGWADNKWERRWRRTARHVQVAGYFREQRDERKHARHVASHLSVIDLDELQMWTEDGGIRVGCVHPSTWDSESVDVGVGGSMRRSEWEWQGRVGASCEACDSHKRGGMGGAESQDGHDLVRDWAEEYPRRQHGEHSCTGPAED